jgi:hypothetical protein
MDPTEHLLRQIDAMRRAAEHPLERTASGAIDSRQTEHPRPRRLPREIGFGPRGASATANRRSFIDPRPAGIAINPR